MEKLTLRDIIRETTNKHLCENNGMLFGECVKDPGGVSNTIPVHESVIDTPMSETAAADIAIGAALSGRRSIYVVRFQNFLLMGASPFISFASVVKGIYGKSAPVFIRAVGCDKLDCNHADMMHSMFMHFSGMKVCAPMTPGEWLNAWETFMQEDQPFFCSEHRDAFNETEEMEDEIYEGARINLFGISKARQSLSEARSILSEHGIKANILHVAWLKPFNAKKYVEILKKTPLGLVTDAGRVICGAPEHIAYELMHAVPGSFIYANGINDLPKSKNPNRYNAVPDAQRIADKALSIIKSRGYLT